ncbi:hypothetical protein [Peptoanaerobacter stomatis]
MLFDIFELDSYDKIRDFIINNPTDSRSKSIIELMYECNLIEEYNNQDDFLMKKFKIQQYINNETQYVVCKLNSFINKIYYEDYAKKHQKELEKYISPNLSVDKDKFFMLFDMFELYTYREIKNYIRNFTNEKRSMDIINLFESFNIKQLFLEELEVCTYE